MVFYSRQHQNKPVFGVDQSTTQSGQSINNFSGQIWYDGANILGLEPSQFLYLKNMEYGTSGSGRYVATRAGNKLVLDLGANIKSFGANTLDKQDDSYLVFIDNNGNLNTLDTANNNLNVIANGVYVGSYNDSFEYKLLNNETLYFANENDGISKISKPNNFDYSKVLDKPITSICYSNMAGRMFAVYGHQAFYSNVQNQTATDTSNLETFGENADILINPTDGKKIYKVRDNGEAVFFFKDTGIWALVNPDEDPLNWIVPKCNSDQGTLSPETISYSNYGPEQGFIYLASDKTLRIFNGHVVRNSGVKPTLTGGDSKVISYPFQKLLDDIPDAYLGKCKGRFFNRYYILNIVSATGNEIDTTIIIDTDKLFQMEGTDIAQPFWFISDDYMCYSDTFAVNSTKLYGINVNGYICQVLTPNQRWDEVPLRIIPTKNYIANNSNSISSASSSLAVTAMTYSGETNRIINSIVVDQYTGHGIAQLNYTGTAVSGSTPDVVVFGGTPYDGRHSVGGSSASWLLLGGTPFTSGGTGFFNHTGSPTKLKVVNHGLADGSVIGISGTINYNGSYIITIIDKDYFTINTEFVLDESSSIIITLYGLNMVAIDYAGYTAWQKVSDYEANLYDAYVNIEVGGMWQVNFVTNSFVLGEGIPPFTDGVVKSIYPYNLGGQFYSLNFYGDNYANGNGQMSMNGYEEARGNYFSFGFYGNNVNEWAKMFSIEPRFNIIKSTPMGTNN